MNLRISTALLITGLLLASVSFAQTTYTLSSSNTWSGASIPTTCANCTITIASGATLTIDKSVTCQNCTFQGGTIAMSNETLNLQLYSSSLIPTYFKSVNFQISGNNGKVVVNDPISLTGSTFTFNNGSAFTTSYEVDLNSSTIYLYDNSGMTSTGGSSTMINLVNSSRIVIGNGSTSSTSMFTVSGPTLALYDASTVVVANDNNVFYNWANYTYSTAPSSPAMAGSGTKSYSTSSSTYNCGGSYPHSCSNPSLYGPATLTASGVVASATLPVVLIDFTAQLNNNNTVAISWSTGQETNSSRFEVERSADGESWTVIGSVEAKGNSSIQSDYSFTDGQPNAGANFYRIKMIDLDNAYTYSGVKVIKASVVSSVSFFPNPARDYVNVSLGTTTGVQVTVRLINAAGQVIQEKQAAAISGSVVTFPVQNVAPGMYFLTVVSTDGSHESRQILISRS